MKGKEILDLLSLGKVPPRVPFAPTIYEHAGRLIGVTPSQMAQNPDLIVEGQLAAYRMYGLDIISVGVDIYNVEAEALGCKVAFNNTSAVPSIEGELVKELSDMENLRVPIPESDGRMPVFTEACRRIKEKIGSEVNINGTIVGPFTLAAILRGYENFLLDIIFETEFAVKQLEFAAKVGLKYAQAFIKNGVGVAINESWIAPPLLSPDLFKRIVFQHEIDLIKDIKAQGLKNVALIIGGNTAPISEHLVKTGTSLLMADYNTNQKEYKRLCESSGINLRASIDSKVVEKGDKAEMEAAVKKVLDNCAANGRFIFGCGVVSFDTPPKNVIMLKKIVNRFNPYRN